MRLAIPILLRAITINGSPRYRSSVLLVNSSIWIFQFFCNILTYILDFSDVRSEICYLRYGTYLVPLIGIVIAETATLNSNRIFKKVFLRKYEPMDLEIVNLHDC